MDKVELSVELTLNEYMRYEVEKRVSHLCQLKRQPKPETPVMDKIEGAGLDATSPYLRVTMDKTNNRVLLEDVGETGGPHVLARSIQSQNFTKPDFEDFHWNPEQYEVIVFNETEGILTVRKRGFLNEAHDAT